MTARELIQRLNSDSLLRDEFRANPVAVVQRSRITVTDAMNIAAGFGELTDCSVRDLDAIRRLLGFIATGSDPGPIAGIDS